MMEVKELPKGHPFTAEQEADRIRWAKRFIARIEGVGQGLGYGIFHGGSLIRDIDIVAVPWSRPRANGSTWDFVSELILTMGLTLGNHGETLFGHHWYALWAPGHPDHQIDLKVIKRAAPKVADDEA